MELNIATEDISIQHLSWENIRILLSDTYLLTQIETVITQKSTYFKVWTYETHPIMLQTKKYFFKYSLFFLKSSPFS